MLKHGVLRILDHERLAEIALAATITDRKATQPHTVSAARS